MQGAQGQAQGAHMLALQLQGAHAQGLPL